MRLIKLSLVVCCLLMGAGVSFGAKKKTTQKTEIAIAKPDTVPVSLFSYAMGAVQSGGLKPYLVQRFGVDTTYMDDFQQGLVEILNRKGDAKLKAYAAGLQIGQEVLEQILPGVNRQITGEEGVSIINEDEFKTGFLSGILDNTKIPMDSALAIAQKQIDYYNHILTEKKYGENRAKGVAFLAANAKKDSVQITKSGLQYKVLIKGTGMKPADTSTVKVNYEGRLIDGTVFDSSYKRGTPAEFGLSNVIKGWTEALKLMPVGSTWEIYIPQELAYGDRQQSTIPPYSTLIFKVELLDIIK